jgi:hypothetical protein
MYLERWLGRDSATGETNIGEVHLSVKDQTRRDSDDEGGLSDFIFACSGVPIPCPRRQSTYGKKGQDGIGVTSPHPPPHCGLSCVVLRMPQCPAISCTYVWDAVGSLRGASPLSKKIGVKTLHALSLAREVLRRAGKEEVGGGRCDVG